MTSVFSSSFIPLDIQAVRQGLGWAQSWSSGPVLCRIHQQRMQMVAVNEEQFVASWAWPLPGVAQSAFFLIPPFVAGSIANPAAYDADGLLIAVQKTAAGMVILQGKQEFRVQWRWDPTSFRAPAHFLKMLEPPPPAMQQSYVALADVVHLAIANMTHMLDNDEFSFSDATIQINLDGAQGAVPFQFDPRLVIRGMEIARGEEVGFALQPLAEGRAMLYFITQREGCQIHCAMLSLPWVAGSQPTTTLTIRETRPPMSDGAWILPRRS
ncbi:MAG: hypothetical protein HC915_05635 [Anaerolineae bacterium]|nr:hypothetical protein [Anaerolineae bacterium]